MAMRKSSITSSTPRRAKLQPRAKAARKAKIAAALDGIEQMEPANSKAAGVIDLLKSWLADESGYDEKTWPKLKKSLNDERRRVGARRLFDE